MEKERGYSMETGNKILKDMVAQRLSSKRRAVQMEVANFDRSTETGLDSAGYWIAWDFQCAFQWW